MYICIVRKLENENLIFKNLENMNTTSNINNENLSSVVSFVETYGNTSKFLNLPTEFPASIYTLCDYILSNDKETTNWKAAADMFRCFATEKNNPFDKVFSDVQILVVTAYDKSVTKTNVKEDNIGNAYNEIISRVKVLKKACADVLMEKCNK